MEVLREAGLATSMVWRGQSVNRKSLNSTQRRGDWFPQVVVLTTILIKNDREV
jgi:hypothetical protein